MGSWERWHDIEPTDEELLIEEVEIFLKYPPEFRIILAAQLIIQKAFEDIVYWEEQIGSQHNND